MNLFSIRIITEDVDNLVKFYETITNLKAIKYTDDFAELKTKNATLAIGSIKTLTLFGRNDIAQAAYNKSIFIEFISNDVDADYKRLENFIKPSILQKPTTMPWGNRSLLFKDPDGNLVNLFTPISKDAQNRFKK
ncbi:VOC family protein [Zhouia sp. PK063]|uniref:VOC family protein n=1 Tax=Zhouia sp. PK063 TaxID=3373602 RepID=UPI0037AE48DA